MRFLGTWVNLAVWGYGWTLRSLFQPKRFYDSSMGFVLQVLIKKQCLCSCFFWGRTPPWDQQWSFPLAQQKLSQWCGSAGPMPVTAPVSYLALAHHFEQLLDLGEHAICVWLTSASVAKRFVQPNPCLWQEVTHLPKWHSLQSIPGFKHIINFFHRVSVFGETRRGVCC